MKKFSESAFEIETIDLDGQIDTATLNRVFKEINRDKFTPAFKASHSGFDTENAETKALLENRRQAVLERLKR